MTAEEFDELVRERAIWLADSGLDDTEGRRLAVRVLGGTSGVLDWAARYAAERGRRPSELTVFELLEWMMVEAKC